MRLNMAAPVELTRPTLLTWAAIVCYLLAMMFHIIAFATESWSSLLLEDGQRWEMGLWRGCRHNATADTWHCSTDVFQDPVFKTGAEWHTGSQVMMTLSLIVLFLLEFLIVAYACIKRAEKAKDKLVGGILALSLTSAFCHFLVIIMYGSEVSQLPESSIGGSYAVMVVAFVLEVFIPIIIHCDKSRRFSDSYTYIMTRIGMSRTARDKKKATASKTPALYTVGGQPLNTRPVSMRTSVSSLTETETYKKFASLSEDPRDNISGSRGSVYTQSTVFTNVSQGDSDSVEHVESMI